MSSEFKQAIASLQRAAREPSRPLREPELARLARRLEKLPTGGGGKEPADIRQVAGEIRRAIDRGIALTNRQLRHAAWCLWNENTRLADDDTVRTRLFESIAVAERPGPFKSLAANFIYAFDVDNAAIVSAGALLLSQASRWDGNWQDLHREYRIFDVIEGPKALAQAVVARDRAPDQILQEHGVDLSGARGGYVKAVVGSLLDHLANGGEPDHDRRLDKVQKYVLTPQGRPIFGDMLGRIAEAILKPFQGATVGKTLRDRALGLVLQVLGDPRRTETQKNWRLVPTALTNLVKSWLAEQSLRQFLDVVDSTANDKYMWQYRRAFWEGVYKLDPPVITEAWVAFGPDGERRAKRDYGRDATFAVLTQSGRQIESGHAVLLLRIGDGVVADWSHNGSCNIWADAQAAGAPKLYQSAYGSNEVRIPGSGNLDTRPLFRVAHTSSDSYNWQGKVADRIYKMTGRRIPESTYQLRR
jgi:hypothetical protein